MDFYANLHMHTTHSDGRAGSVTGLNEGTVSNVHTDRGYIDDYFGWMLICVCTVSIRYILDK